MEDVYFRIGTEAEKQIEEAIAVEQLPSVTKEKALLLQLASSYRIATLPGLALSKHFTKSKPILLMKDG